MCILSLIQDCLENIFHRLSLEDLLNVAQSNSILKASACSVFTRKHGSSTIVFTHPPIMYVRKKCFEGTLVKEILNKF